MVFWRAMKSAVIALCMIWSGTSLADQWHVSAAEWSQPRNGEALLSHPGISAAVQELLRSEDSSLELHYAGGDEGLLWASELRGWLIALGLESARIELVPGGGRKDRLRLQVTEHPVGAGTYP